jgi:hypothetical protein
MRVSVVGCPLSLFSVGSWFRPTKYVETSLELNVCIMKEYMHLRWLKLMDSRCRKLAPPLLSLFAGKTVSGFYELGLETLMSSNACLLFLVSNQWSVVL